MIAVFGPLLCCLLIVIWWLTASRATWKERLFGFLGLAASLAVVLVLVHPTMRGPGTAYLTLPMGMLAFALAAAALRQQRPARRTGVAVLIALAGFGFSLLLRNEGMTGDYELGKSGGSCLYSLPDWTRGAKEERWRARGALSLPERFITPDISRQGRQGRKGLGVIDSQAPWRLAHSPAATCSPIPGNRLLALYRQPLVPYAAISVPYTTTSVPCAASASPFL